MTVPAKPPTTADVPSLPARPSFTLLDWALTVVAVLCVTAVVWFSRVSACSFADMFRDFGANDELPVLTRFALSRGYGPTFALPAVLVLGNALRTRRRAWAFGAAVVGATSVVAATLLFQVAMYSPIWSLSDKIAP